MNRFMPKNGMTTRKVYSDLEKKNFKIANDMFIAIYPKAIHFDTLAQFGAAANACAKIMQKHGNPQKLIDYFTTHPLDVGLILENRTRLEFILMYGEEWEYTDKYLNTWGTIDKEAEEAKAKAELKNENDTLKASLEEMKKQIAALQAAMPKRK